MEKERLDQILLREGLVTENQIRQALLRQKSHRGPLGSHLLYFKFKNLDTFFAIYNSIANRPTIRSNSAIR